MYIIKLPSYTNNLKIYGSDFFIYEAPESNIKKHTNFLTAECIGYKDIKRDQYIIRDVHVRVYNTNIEPDFNNFFASAWRGESYFACFEKYEDALVYKALANKKVKEKIIEKLNKQRETVIKHLDKVYDESIILNKYPEYML